MDKILKKFPINLKTVSVQTMNIGMGHRLFFFFLAGIVAGTVGLNFLAGTYAGKIGVYSQYFIDNIAGVNTSEFDKWSFFIYCIKKYVVEVAILLVVNCVSIWKIFDCLYCVYRGMAISILVSSATITYGSGGLLLYVMSIFPHYFTYVPMIVFTLFLGMKIKENIKSDKLLVPVIRGIAIEIILIVLTSFLEAYCNYPFIKSVFK